MSVSAVLKVCTGVLSVGTVTFVPLYYLNVFSSSSTATQPIVNQVSSSEIPKAKPKVQISQDSEQVKQDSIFDICQKTNTIFHVRDSKGAERDIAEINYKSSDGTIVKATYPQGKCTREIKSQQ